MVQQEKKTGRIGRLAGWLVSIGLILGVACLFVSQYPRITTGAKKEYSDYVEQSIKDQVDRRFINAYTTINGMYVGWYKHSVGMGGLTEGEIILGPILQQYKSEKAYEIWYNNRKETLTDWYEKTYPSLLEMNGLDYFIYKDSVEDGVGTLTSEEAALDAAGYPVYVKIWFNEFGMPVVKAQRGTGNVQNGLTSMQETVAALNQYEVNYETGETVTQGQLKNMTVLLAGDEQYYRNLTEEIFYPNWAQWEMVHAMKENYLISVLLAVGVSVLLGLLLPVIRPLGLKEGWKAHIPVELLAILGGYVALDVVWDQLPMFIVKSKLAMDYGKEFFYRNDVLWNIGAEDKENILILTCNALIWFAVFFLAYLCAINVRQLFVKGVVRFLKENTLTGRLLGKAYKAGKRAVQFCQKIEFSHKWNRFFIFAAAVNFLVIALLCCLRFVGILLAIPYTVTVIWLLQKKWKEIRTDYTVLLSTTEEMAKGITDVEYIGTAGVFHELQTALSGVQEGFRTAVQEEVKSQKMKTELVTNVSHDLKTPLTAIITYVDLLKNENLTAEERQDYVEILDRKSARLKVLIEDLFEISKATSGNVQLDNVDLDLVQLIQEVQLELEEEIMNSGIAFKLNLPQEKVMVHLDAQKTCRIFENLTVNILKHGLKGSRAYISMEQTEKEVRVVYKNISSEEINYNEEEILERFTRGDASRNTEGSGLGLAIVKSFTEAQGGTVRVNLEDDLFKVIVSFPKI